MKYKKECIVCGCLMDEDHESNICEVCKEDLDESNPYRQWERDYKD